ncbi:ORF6C domain-containing protein [Dorea longicatena]|uniref:ORF6C domain-containing protein n=1 Tax=Dorea longicatena TaxID=88431 RepID=UPI0034A3D345
MNELQIFNSEEFGDIRTVTIDNEPFFCMADICKALEISNVSQVKTRLNQDGVISNEVIDSIGRKQNANFVNESNMYKLIFQSRKESAERFTDWVTSEVLPAIRKTGSYQNPMTTDQKIQLLAQGNVELTEKVNAIDKDLQEFKQDMPLLALECQRITRAKNQKVVPLMGGKNAPAYKNKSLMHKVYSDVDAQLRREFGVNTYKAIKRSQCDLAVEIIKKYELPRCLREEIEDENSQMRFVV